MAAYLGLVAHDESHLSVHGCGSQIHPLRQAVLCNDIPMAAQRDLPREVESLGHLRMGTLLQSISYMRRCATERRQGF